MKYIFALLLLVGCGRPKDSIEITMSSVQQESEVAPVGHHWEERRCSRVVFSVLVGCVGEKFRTCSGMDTITKIMPIADVPDYIKNALKNEAFNIEVTPMDQRRLVHDDWEDVKP
jgi:hypothetical protein